MRTRAAVMWQNSGDFEITELDLDPPKEREVLVRYEYAGLCHSDEHMRQGDYTFKPPMVGGHEGAGVVEDVGPGVTQVKPGDHFITSWMPMCGRCRFCLMGKSNLCDNGAYITRGAMLDRTYRLHGRGKDVGATDLIGTFSQWGVVPESSLVVIDDDVPLEAVSIAACAVPTGWGSAVYAAGTRPGDTIVVYGVGGIGINAVQGAAHAGAAMIVGVDPVEFKREMALELGATHAFATAEEAHEFIWSETRGQGADACIVTTSLAGPKVVGDAFRLVRKAGTVVVTSLARADTLLTIPSLELTAYEKRLVGSLFGSGAPHLDIKNIVRLYQQGKLRLDELITRRYPLDEINQGYDDLLAGKNIRGVLDIDH